MRRVSDRALGPPDLVLFPDRTTGHELAMVDAVARSPLRFEVDQAGVRDQALVPRRRRLEPVGQMPAVARARGCLTRTVDEGEALDGFVRGGIEVVTRAAQRITLDGLPGLVA